MVLVKLVTPQNIKIALTVWNGMGYLLRIRKDRRLYFLFFLGINEEIYD